MTTVFVRSLYVVRLRDVALIRWRGLNNDVAVERTYTEANQKDNEFLPAADYFNPIIVSL
jgi:hypothetical protein